MVHGSRSEPPCTSVARPGLPTHRCGTFPSPYMAIAAYLVIRRQAVPGPHITDIDTGPHRSRRIKSSKDAR